MDESNRSFHLLSLLYYIIFLYLYYFFYIICIVVDLYKDLRTRIQILLSSVRTLLSLLFSSSKTVNNRFIIHLISIHTYSYLYKCTCIRFYTLKCIVVLNKHPTGRHIYNIDFQEKYASIKENTVKRCHKIM